MEKAPITSMAMESIRFWMRDQSDHAVFLRSDLTVKHVPKADRALDYSLKFQELEGAAMRGEEKLGGLV